MFGLVNLSLSAAFKSFWQALFFFWRSPGGLNLCQSQIVAIARTDISRSLAEGVLVVNLREI
jgi:hypothetical protein